MDECASRQHLRERIVTDLPADELDRLARVDALLRLVAARDRAEAESGAAGSERTNA